MAKRFGRNQRRQMHEQLATTTSALNAAIHGTDLIVDRMKREHADDIRAARMARDTIRISVDSLLDPRERDIRMRAEPVYSAIDIRERDYMRKSDTEREAFIELVGKELAQHALTQIMRHWRSR